MRTAIITKYLSPTNTKGARISATANGFRAVVPFDFELDDVGRHRQAAEALCAKMNWKGRLIAGGLEIGFVFVFAD